MPKKTKRKKKYRPDLTPKELLADLSKRADNGQDVRDVPEEAKGPDGSSVPVSCPAASTGPGRTRVFGADDIPDDIGDGESESQTISDNSRPDVSRLSGSKLSKTLKRKLYERGPDGFVNEEIIAESIMDSARNGRQWAIELILERIEGKASKTAEEPIDEQKIEDRLESVTIDRLNDIVKSK